MPFDRWRKDSKLFKSWMPDSSEDKEVEWSRELDGTEDLGHWITFLEKHADSLFNASPYYFWYFSQSILFSGYCRYGVSLESFVFSDLLNLVLWLPLFFPFLPPCPTHLSILQLCHFELMGCYECFSFRSSSFRGTRWVLLILGLSSLLPHSATFYIYAKKPFDENETFIQRLWLTSFNPPTSSLPKLPWSGV